MLTVENRSRREFDVDSVGPFHDEATNTRFEPIWTKLTVAFQREKLEKSSRTILGEKIRSSKGQRKVRSAIVVYS